MTALLERPAPAPALTSAAPRTRRGLGTALGLGAYLVLQLGVLAVFRAVAPRFFWVDDEQAQYLPAFGWLGRHLDGGRPPLFDPDLGASGNFLADPQYGVLDPLHWLLYRVVASTDSLTRAGWLIGGAAVLVMGSGVLVLLRSHAVRLALAVPTAVALASSGFFLWFGSSWWPLMWSTAWLPWLWSGLGGRRWTSVLAAGFAAYALGAAGYPYNLVIAGVLVLAHVGEHLWRQRLAGHRWTWRPGSWAAGWWRSRLAVRLLAAAGGLLAASPSLLAAQQLAAYTQRGVPESGSGNLGILIPNALDTVLGGPTLSLSFSGNWSGSLFEVPLLATAVFTVPALALVGWRTAIRRRGVLTAAVMSALAVLLTQMPTYVGQFRYPLRYLAAVELFLPVLAVLGLLAETRTSRRRLVVAGGLVGAQFVLAVLRAPAVWHWHVAAAVATGAAVAALCVTALPVATRRRVAAASTVLVLATVAGPLLGLGSASALRRADEATSQRPLTGLPARQVLERPDWGTTVQEFRAQVVAPGATVTIPVWGDHGTGDGWGAGVLVGNGNLVADMRTGFGYIASGQGAWTKKWCLDFASTTTVDAACVAGLLATVPGTTGSWVDLLSSDTVLLSSATPAPIRAYFDEHWVVGPVVGDFTTYRRAHPIAPRVTWTSPSVTAISGVGPGDRPGYAGEPLDRYTVSTSGTATVLLRIPWWPGLRATVAGRAVPVTSVDGVMARLDLPAGLRDAPVQVDYDLAGARLLWPAMATGAALVAAALALAVAGRVGRRPRRVPRGV